MHFKPFDTKKSNTGNLFGNIVEWKVVGRDYKSLVTLRVV